MIVEGATHFGDPHMIGRTLMPLAARSPTSLSGTDQSKCPDVGSMRGQNMIQRTVVAPLFSSMLASFPVISLNT